MKRVEGMARVGLVALAVALLLGPATAGAWNPGQLRQLKASRSCVGCDLTYADLSGPILAGADLRWADLSYANVADADLAGADLSYATWIDGRPCKAGSIGRCIQ